VQSKDGCTSLYVAACYGHAEVTAQLLAGGANVDVQCKAGFTAIYWATEKGHAEVFAKLLAARAKVDLEKILNDNTALQLARANGRTVVVALLSVFKRLFEDVDVDVDVSPNTWKRSVKPKTGGGACALYGTEMTMCLPSTETYGE